MTALDLDEFGTWMRIQFDLLRRTGSWKFAKKLRPNFDKMSLNMRTLEAAGVLKEDGSIAPEMPDLETVHPDYHGMLRGLYGVAEEGSADQAITSGAEAYPGDGQDLVPIGRDEAHNRQI